MTFETVKMLGEWTPIRDCPGRFVLRGVSPSFGISDLLGDVAGIEHYQSPRARDAVWVVCFEDGGTISYCRPDDTWLHTLNTEEGFRRKLEQLEISLHESVAQRMGALKSISSKVVKEERLAIPAWTTGLQRMKSRSQPKEPDGGMTRLSFRKKQVRRKSSREPNYRAALDPGSAFCCVSGVAGRNSSAKPNEHRE